MKLQDLLFTVAPFTSIKIIFHEKIVKVTPAYDAHTLINEFDKNIIKIYINYVTSEDCDLIVYCE